MGNSSTWSRMWRKANPATYGEKDAALVPSLTTKDMIAMGVGTVVGAGIFVIPGIVAADYAGPAVTLSFVIAAFVAGLSALAYSEFASSMPFAGSIYSWANVIYGEFVGWLAGWAILSEYLIALAFLSSAWSAYFRGFVESVGVQIPTAVSGSLNLSQGSFFDLFGAISILLVGLLVARGIQGAAIIENALVILKIGVILLFVIVGATAVQVANWVPFIPAHKNGTDFGGWTGVLHGAAQVFFTYIGFDTIAANSAEAKNPQKTMPRAIIGTLVIATVLFVAVSAVLTGMFPYQDYAGNAEPAAWALRRAGHILTANILSVVALVGMFTGLIALMIGGSRLVYSFARDGLVTPKLAKLDRKQMPLNATIALSFFAIVMGSLFPVSMLANLVSAGTLIAFIAASVGILVLRRRKDLDHSGYQMPGFPVLPILSAIFSTILFFTLSNQAILLTLAWLALGAIIYFVYGIRHSVKNNEN